MSSQKRKPIKVKGRYPKKNNNIVWMHINLHLSDKFKEHHLYYIKKFIAVIYTRIFTCIDKAFYLPEGDFIMFSVEIKNRALVPVMKRIVKDIDKTYLKKVPYIEKITVEIDTNDYENGDGFLIVMDAITKFNLFYEDNSVSHLIHCISANCLLKVGKERELYRAMSRIYE